MQYQWYPGHMSKAKRQMQEDIKLIDVVVELVDARIPASSRNPDLDSLAKNKSRVLLLNKADLADEEATKLWNDYYTERGFFVVNLDSRNSIGTRQVHEAIKKSCAEKLERDRRRGIIGRPLRAMVVGIPNVGKSTFINSFAGRACAKTGNRPGVTKGRQWIRLNKNVELLDTPGILWPKFEEQEIGLRIALIGSINGDILQPEELALELLKFLRESYTGMTGEKYSIEETDDIVENLRRIAVRRACLKKGGEPDLERAAAFVLDDFRNGRIGRITLERP